MLTLNKHGLTVPTSDDVRATYGDLLNGQVADLTKIIDQTRDATTKAMNNTRMGRIEQAEMVEQIQTQARSQVSAAVESRRKKLAEAEAKAKVSDRQKLPLVQSAWSVLNHNETRALQVVGGR